MLPGLDRDEANPYNASWLESNGQYNSATVYPDMWSQLQVELNSSLNVGDTIDISGKTYVKRGLPVVLSSAAYTDYDFVINTSYSTFRLPLKTKLASGNAVVGNGMTLGLTNGTQLGGLQEENDNTIRVRKNAYGKPIGTSWQEGDMYDKTLGITTDPTKSGIQTSDSGLYLYFYVGDTVQDASLINAGAVLGQLANLNAASRGYVVDSYHNGTEWYRIYSDGWIEQGGLGPSHSGEKTITLYKPYSNANYTIIQTPYSSAGSGSFSSAIKSQTNTSFVLAVESNYANGFYWTTCGY